MMSDSSLLSPPVHGRLMYALTFAAGAFCGCATVLGYLLHQKYKSRLLSNDKSLDKDTKGVAGLQGGYRRAVSAEETPSERLSRQRRIRRLWSTSGSATQDEAPTIQVEAGKNDETQAILNLLYYIADDQAKSNGFVHRGITCNGCNQSPLFGIRFKCANCPDYDVCDRCEPKDVHNSSHVFLKISTPLPPLASPRAMLTKILYPGKANNFNFLSLDETLAYTRITHFDQYEVEAIHQEYRSLARSERGISQEVFDICAGPLALHGNLVLQRLFKFYDQNDDKFIDFDEMIKGMSILVKGSKVDKKKFAFDGYDVENKGLLSRDNVRRMFKAYFDITIELVRDMVKACEEEMMANFDDNTGRPVSSLFSAPIPSETSTMGSNNFNKQPTPSNPGSKESTWPVMEAMSQDAIDEMVDNIFKTAELTGEDRMAFEQFADIAELDHELLGWIDALGTVF